MKAESPDSATHSMNAISAVPGQSGREKQKKGADDRKKVRHHRSKGFGTSEMALYKASPRARHPEIHGTSGAIRILHSCLERDIDWTSKERRQIFVLLQAIQERRAAQRQENKEDNRKKQGQAARQ
jgi:hypothetical protein